MDLPGSGRVWKENLYHPDDSVPILLRVKSESSEVLMELEPDDAKLNAGELTLMDVVIPHYHRRRG